MKVQKSVNEKGRVVVEITDIPELPEGTRVGYDYVGFQVNGKEEAEPVIQGLKLGDYKMKLTDNMKYHPKENTAKEIDEALTRRFEEFVRGYQGFCDANTETVEVVPPDRIAEPAPRIYSYLLHRKRRAFAPVKIITKEG